MKNNLYTKLIMSAAVVAISSPAVAAGGHDHDHHDHTTHGGDSPFYGHLHVRVHADSIIDAEEADEEFNEVYTHSHLELGARLGEGFSINSNLKLEGEPSGHNHGHGGGGSAADGSDRFFEDHPLLVEQLTLNYDNERFSVYAGKFNPLVSFDYHKFPGVYGYQTIESYAIRERIGLGGAIKHNAGDYGKHRARYQHIFC